LQNFTLYEKLCDLAEWLFPIAERWPKHEKFVLVTQTKNCVHDMTRIAILAAPLRFDVQGFGFCVAQLAFLSPHHPDLGEPPDDFPFPLFW
jgi:hypothetical protein